MWPQGSCPPNDYWCVHEFEADNPSEESSRVKLFPEYEIIIRPEEDDPSEKPNE